ncbi:hypothetical protein Poly30_23720 [Planctomycetes bacterium Poly30]|uniref:Uncharacterized protein n=1 Tax=Saltatorellus ferox TaxID=2528018 RepID=A0A518ES24_9BACT|nr:hypothetical protein Poly30_23720 [Planctomycetes bacterium Poly30]
MIDSETPQPEPDNLADPELSSYGTVPVGAITDAELGAGDATSPEADRDPAYETWDPEVATDDPEHGLSGADSTLARFSRAEPLVVLLSPSEVEVLAPRAKGSPAHRMAGSSRLIQFTHDLPIGKALASHIVTTLKQHGVARRSIRLALSHEFLPAQIIEVPDLPSKELTQVVARRSAALIDATPQEVTFTGLALDGPDREERRWLVHAMLAKPLIAMQTELRAQGWVVRDVVPARTAPFLSVRSTTLAGEGRATLVLVFDRESAAIGLVSGGRLAHLSTLPGSLDMHLAGEQVARALVQELRGVDAFWRRSSRGDQVTDILILGAVRSALDRLAPAIRMALGDVRVAGAIGAMPFQAEGAGWIASAPNEARIDLLRALRSPRVAALDLSLPLRPRGRSIAAVAMSSLVLCSTVALAMRDGMNGLTSSISTEARVVEAASADLEALRERQARASALEAQLIADCQELQQLEGLGISATPILAGLRRAFGDGTRLLSMRAIGLAVGGAAISPALGEVGALHVRGVVIDDPEETTRALHRLRAALGRVPGVVNVQIEPPSLSDLGPIGVFGPGNGSLRFLATARLVPVGQESAYGKALRQGPEQPDGAFEALPGGN